MKRVRFLIILAFLIFTAFFIYNWMKTKKLVDRSFPTIEFSEEMLKLPVDASKEDLMSGIIALDQKDGDLTGSVIVESVSKFVDKKKHISNVTYVVRDSDKNVTKATRKVQFDNYRPPRFTLSQPLSLEVGSDIKVSDIIGAYDQYDGDITRNVKILSSTVSTNSSGEYTITAQVTNSFGDTVKLKAVVLVQQKNNLSPTINLKHNIVYLNKGDKFNENEYISNVTNRKGKEVNADVEVVSSNVDTDKTGCYYVQYAVNEGEDNQGSAYLTVVVVED